MLSVTPPEQAPRWNAELVDLLEEPYCAPLLNEAAIARLYHRLKGGGPG